MSKSLGNFFTVRDLLDQGVPGEVIRFVFLSTHYRKPMDWTEKKAKEAEATLESWALLTKDVEESSVADEAFIAHLSNDLNTAGAIAEMHKMKTELRFADLKAAMRFMSLEFEATEDSVNAYDAFRSTLVADDVDKLAKKLADFRQMAMLSKDFSQVDSMKTSLISAGIEVRMSKDGVQLVRGPNFDPSKLEGLL